MCFNPAQWEGLTMDKDYRKCIVVNPQVHFGKPCIAGTRITVESVLELAKEGISFEEIIQKYYPDLEIEDIKACLEYIEDLYRSSR